MDNETNVLLRLGMTKKAHSKLYDVIPKGVLEGHILTLWNAQAKFYREFPNVDGIDDVDAWKVWLTSGPLSKHDEDQRDLCLLIADKCAKPVSQELMGPLTNKYLQDAMQLDTMDALETFNDPNNETDLIDLLEAVKDRYKERLERSTVSPIENSSMDDLYADEVNNTGFKWRLPELARHMRPVRPGDAIVWAARPDRGKTTTIASEISYMISQMDEVYPGKNKTFIWFNNEGCSKSIRRRLFQAALGVKGSQMLEWHRDGTLIGRLHEAFGGESIFNRIMIMSIHGYSSTQVLRLIKEHNPGLIVFDMVDNIRFNGLSTNGGTRTDQMLEEMYKWVRDHAQIDEYAAFETSQVSADGEQVAYPNMAMLKDSKTGKQGACDAIVIFGEREQYPNERYLGIPKNKLKLEGMPQNPKCPIWFDPEIARIASMEDMAEE